MKSVLQKFKEEVYDFRDYHTEIQVQKMNRSKYEKLFDYFDQKGFKIKFFVSVRGEEKEVIPEVILPLGPDDRSWNMAKITGNGIGYSIEFSGEYVYLAMSFLADDISTLQRARSLAKLMMDMTILLKRTVTINGGSSDTVVAKSNPREKSLLLYPEPEYINVRPSLSKKTRKS